MEILKPGFPQQLGKASPTTLGFPTSPHRSGDDHHQLNLLTEGVGQIRRSKVGHTGWTKPAIISGNLTVGTEEILLEGPLRIEGLPVFIPILISVGCFTVGAVMIWAGRGLLRYDNRARIVTLITAVVLLSIFPLGTAIGIYAGWALLTREGKVYFGK